MITSAPRSLKRVPVRVPREAPSRRSFLGPRWRELGPVEEPWPAVAKNLASPVGPAVDVGCVLFFWNRTPPPPPQNGACFFFFWGGGRLKLKTQDYVVVRFVRPLKE